MRSRNDQIQAVVQDENTVSERESKAETIQQDGPFRWVRTSSILEAKPSAAVATDVGEDAAAFSLEEQTSDSWQRFSAAVALVLGALYVLWVRADTGYGDDFMAALETFCGGNSHLVTLCLGIIFPIAHSGLASLRPAAEKVVGARAWRVLFALVSLPLAYSWIVYFIAHRYDGLMFWDLHASSFAHSASFILSYLSFFFLYPSTFNLLEVAAIEKPQLHLWESGVVRITRHPQMVGQVMWSVAHLAWVGSSFTALTMSMLVGHHLFSVWNGDRRLLAKHGEQFEKVRDRTSVVPFAAIIDGRQKLPPDYYKEWLRGPYALIAVATLGAYAFHPFMQAGAALVQNTGLQPGGILG